MPVYFPRVPLEDRVPVNEVAQSEDVEPLDRDMGKLPEFNRRNRLLQELDLLLVDLERKARQPPGLL